MAHANEDLIRKLYDAFAKGDLETVRNAMADDILIHWAGRSWMGGDHRGPDDNLATLGKLFELSGGTLKIELHDAVANDQHTVALSNVSAQREGKSLEDKGIEVYHVSGGKITEAWFTGMDLATWDEFWS